MSLRLGDTAPNFTTELGRTAALKGGFDDADPDHTVAELYDMIHPGEGDTSTVRSVFVIDPAHEVRLILTHPKSTGRNFDEILRVIDSLQLTDAHEVATPVDRVKGDRVIASPGMSTDDAKARFDNVEVVKPYLRWFDDPRG